MKIYDGVVILDSQANRLIGTIVALIAAMTVGSVNLSVPTVAATPRPSTLDVVRERGIVNCGVSKNAVGLSQVDDSGKWSGLAVDYCAALAAATLGRSDAVAYIPLSAASRFTALLSGQVDLVVSNTSWTLSRDTIVGLQFAAPLFFEGTALLVRMDQNVESVLELAGASVCTLAGSATQQNIETFFRLRKMRYEVVAFDKWADALQAYQSKRCLALAGDATVLTRAKAGIKDADQQKLLPERLALEALGPAVRTDDEHWLKIVKWTVAALLRAEELGLTRDNVDAKRGQTDAVLRLFLGAEGPVVNKLGLRSDWTYQILRQVGNYGERFDVHFGAGSALKMDRSLNRLWSAGGLHVAPHFH